MIKKFFISFLALTTILSMTGSVFALGTFKDGEKQLLTDGDMEAAGISWASGGAATLSKSTDLPHSGNKALRATYSGSATAYIYITPTGMTPGETYKLGVWTRTDGTATMRFQDGVVWFGIGPVAPTEWTYYEAVVTAGGSSLYWEVTFGGGTWAEIDDVVFTEYKGETLNAEKQVLVNGDLEIGATTGWIAGASATLTADTTSPFDGTYSLKVAHNGTNSPYAYQAVSAATKYHVTGVASGDGTFAPNIRDHGGTLFWTGTNSTSWQYFDLTYTSVGSRLDFVCGATGAGYCKFDNVTVTKYKGETLNAEKQIMADGDMEASGTTAWTANLSSTPSKVAGYYGVGLQTVAGSNTNYTGQTATVSGSRYKVSGYYRVTGGGGNAVIRSTTSIVATLGNLATWTYFSAEFTAVSSFWGVGASLNGTTVQWDELTLTRL